MAIERTDTSCTCLVYFHVRILTEFIHVIRGWLLCIRFCNLLNSRLHAWPLDLIECCNNFKIYCYVDSYKRHWFSRRCRVKLAMKTFVITGMATCAARSRPDKSPLPLAFFECKVAIIGHRTSSQLRLEFVYPIQHRAAQIVNSTYI